MELFKLFGTIAINNDEANEAIDDTADKGEQAESRLSSAFKKIGAVVATAFAIDKIVSFGKEVVGVAAEVSAEVSAFEQIMGDYSDEASKKVEKIADATGMVSTRLTPYMTSMTAKFKGLGYDVDEATDFAARGLNLAADAAAFWDKSLDESTGHLNSFINGSYEGGEAIGLFANDTQMAMFAVEQGIVADTKAWSNLDEATKQATRLEYAEKMFEMSGATGQAAKEADQYANVQANLTEKWRQFKAQIGEPILQNIVLPAMQKLSGLVDIASEKFEALKKFVSDNKDRFVEIGNYLKQTFSPVLEAVKNLFGAVKDALQPLIDKIKDFVTDGNNASKAVEFLKGAIESLSSILTDAVNYITDFVNWLSQGSTGAEVFKGIVVGLTAGFAAYKTVTLAVTAAQKAQVLWTNAVAAAQKALNLVMSMNPIGLVIAAIVGLVAAFIYLWNNCESFREFWIGLWEKVKEIAGSVADWFKEKWKVVSDWFKNLWKEIKETVSSIWESISNKIKTVVNTIKSFIEKAFTFIKEKIIAPIKNAYNTVKTTFENIRKSISDKVTAAKNKVTEIFNNIKSTIQEKIESARDKVSTAVEKVKSLLSFSGLKKKVSTLFDDIKEKIQSPINKAKETVTNAVKKIKGIFPISMGKIFSGIKLPHFKISGGKAPWGIGGQGTKPSIGIDWYAKAMENPMLLRKATIFGMNSNGDLLGGGEKGDEFVGGTDALTTMVRGAVKQETAGISDRLEALISMLAEYMPELIKNSNKQIVMNSGALVGELAPAMDSRLGEINRLRGRGR